MVQVIQEAAAAAGSRLVLHSTGSDAAGELEILRDLGQRFVDGLICRRPGRDRGPRRGAARGRSAGRRHRAAAEGPARRHRRGRLAPGCRARRPPPARARPAPDRVRQRPRGHHARPRAAARLPRRTARGRPGARRDLVEVAAGFTAEAGYDAAERLLHRGPPGRDPVRERPARGGRPAGPAQGRASRCPTRSRSSGWTTPSSPALLPDALERRPRLGQRARIAVKLLLARLTARATRRSGCGSPRASSRATRPPDRRERRPRRRACPHAAAATGRLGPVGPRRRSCWSSRRSCRSFC